MQNLFSATEEEDVCKLF